MKRAWLALAAALVLGAAATVYMTHTAASTPAAPPTSLRGGQLYFRDGGGQVASVSPADPDGSRQRSGLRCDRFAAAWPTAVCLTADVTNGLPATTAVILDRDLRETRRLQLAGIPSRASVSPSGRMVAWTVFVTGDSYSQGGFSTWTGILDTRTGYVVTNIENIHLYLNGGRHHAADVNYWGVTFAADDTTFYATVSTRGATYLVRGDYARWEARAVLAGVECPSLSPDATRVAYKKPAPGRVPCAWPCWTCAPCARWISPNLRASTTRRSGSTPGRSPTLATATCTRSPPTAPVHPVSSSGTRPHPHHR